VAIEEVEEEGVEEAGEERRALEEEANVRRILTVVTTDYELYCYSCEVVRKRE